MAPRTIPGQKDRGITFEIDAYDFKGRSDMPVRYTGQYGDNAMVDTAKSRPEKKVRPTGQFADNAMVDTASLNESEDDNVQRLMDMLTQIGVSETHLAAGVKLKPEAMQRVAAALGCAPTDVPILLRSISSKLRSDDARRPMPVESRGGDVYSYEADVLGNITVRNRDSGKEVFLRGTKASQLLSRIEHGDDEQAVLAHYAGRSNVSEKKRPRHYRAALDTHSMWYNIVDMNGRIVAKDVSPNQDRARELADNYRPGMVIEELDESTEADQDDFDEEMKQTSGSFNFPWNHAGEHGTATARYKTRDGGLVVTVVHVRDKNGEEVSSTSRKSALHAQAVAFIGDE